MFTYHHSLLDTSVAEVLRGGVPDATTRCAAARSPTLEERPAVPGPHPVAAATTSRTRAERARRTTRAASTASTTPTTSTPLQVPAGRSGRPAAGHDTRAVPHLAATTSEPGSTLCSAARPCAPSTFVEAAWALVLAAFSGDDRRRVRLDPRLPPLGDSRARGHHGPVHQHPAGAGDASTAAHAAAELLRELRAAAGRKRRARAHAAVDIQAVLDVPRGTPLFDTIVVVNDAPEGTRLKALGGPFAARDFDLHDQTNFPLTCSPTSTRRSTFKLSYDRRRFERAGHRAGRRPADGASSRRSSTQPDATLGELPRAARARTRVGSHACNDTRAHRSRPPVCVHEPFEAQVDRTPDAIAVIFRGTSLTYRELDERANPVAARAARARRRARPMVGVFVERSVEMMVGLLGILKAGGAYVPMDPGLPARAHRDDARGLPRRRRAHARRPARARCRRRRATVLELDALRHRGQRTAPCTRGVGPHHLAYVIFTSGSTGRPKGVMIEHRNVANFFTGMDEALLGHDARASGWRSPASRSTSRCSSCSGR